ncbi:MAG: prepilin-type N-terminal cleavage/methylation domain-containing protein [Chthoniobacter sp.]
MRLPWIKLVAILLVIWAVVGGVIWWARSVKPTPETVMRYLDAHPIANASAQDRDKALEKVAKDLNQLPYEQRREVRMSRKLDAFFRALPPDDQTRFLDLTLPTGFKQMMDALNKMTPEKRKDFVNKALTDMKKHEGDDVPEDKRNLDANGQKIIDQGFRSFYSDASAETKMDVAPLIEQLQKKSPGLAMNRPVSRAFTLIEILVVLAIIGILSAFAYPVYQKSVEGSRASACLSNLRQLGAGLNAYLNDNEMKMPTLQLGRDSIDQNVPVIGQHLRQISHRQGRLRLPGGQQEFGCKDRHELLLERGAQRAVGLESQFSATRHRYHPHPDPLGQGRLSSLPQRQGQYPLRRRSRDQGREILHGELMGPRRLWGRGLPVRHLFAQRGAPCVPPSPNRGAAGSDGTGFDRPGPRARRPAAAYSAAPGSFAGAIAPCFRARSAKGVRRPGGARCLSRLSISTV